LGMQPFLQFIALFSISIGVLNLLPIPLLDGGRLLYDATEFFTGRPCSTRILNFTHQWGLVIIVLMTSLALYNDLKILLGTL
ncbi:MAG: site-2 protease family protein, partial [Methylophilaceae bacterium]|nr:site-2 protease family protein [Methylophilaceae bacterium]